MFRFECGGVGWIVLREREVRGLCEGWNLWLGFRVCSFGFGVERERG